MLTKITSIFLNSILVILSFVVLYNEYLINGKLIWIDEDRIEEKEEFFIIPILAIIVVLGIFSIAYETILIKNPTLKNKLIKLLVSFLRSLTYIYICILLLVSISFMLLTLNNIGNHSKEDGFVISVFIIIIILFITGLIGPLIVYNEIQHKSRRKL